MKLSIFFKLAIVASTLSTTAFADDWVHGFVRRDGTYVQPHHRTTPNLSVFDNYSTKGNVNPYTAERGSVDPLRAERLRPDPQPYLPAYQPRALRLY